MNAEERLAFQHFSLCRVGDMVRQLTPRQAMDAAWYVQSTLELCGRQTRRMPGLPQGTDLGSDDCWGLWLYHQKEIKDGLEQMDLDQIDKLHVFVQQLHDGLVRARQPQTVDVPEMLLAGLWDSMSASQWDTLVDHCHATLLAILDDQLRAPPNLQWHQQKRERQFQMRPRLLLHGPKFCQAVKILHARALADTQVAQRKENKKKYHVLQGNILQRMRFGTLWFEPSRFRRRSPSHR